EVAAGEAIEFQLSPPSIVTLSSWEIWSLSDFRDLPSSRAAAPLSSAAPGVGCRSSATKYHLPSAPFTTRRSSTTGTAVADLDCGVTAGETGAGPTAVGIAPVGCGTGNS